MEELSSGKHGIYPPGNDCCSLLLKIAIEIMIYPFKMNIFHSFLYDYQRVKVGLPSGKLDKHTKKMEHNHGFFPWVKKMRAQWAMASIAK